MLYNGSRVNAACCNRSSTNEFSFVAKYEFLMNVRRNTIFTSASRAFDSSYHPANAFLVIQ